MKLEIGKQYKTRAGGRAVVVSQENSNFLAWQEVDGCIRLHQPDGAYVVSDGTPSPYDLMSDWVEPRTGWINIIEAKGGFSSMQFPTREDADVYAEIYTSRIACVQWTEGQGLKDDGAK